MGLRGPGAALNLPRTADGRPILSRSDLERWDRPRLSGGRERYVCPIHGGDHQRSLSVDPATGAYLCFACGARGVLREHWPERAGATPGATPVAATRAAPSRPSVEEIGRDALERGARVDAARGERMAGAAPPRDAAAFLRRLDAMAEALRDPECPGAAYLRARGLDPALAADLGAGYAAPNAWPGDRGRRAGRIVYPLADPATGRAVSAVGRLCVDPSERWSDSLTAAFKAAKQRKLAGCPAGVWPHQSIASARRDRRPLVVVEGPADALALLGRAAEDLDVVALVGTANILPAALLRALPGVVLALDADGAGARSMHELRDTFAIAGVRVETLPGDWLGGAKDAGDLAAGMVTGDGDKAAAAAAQRYEDAVSVVRVTCQRLVSAGWNDDAVARLLTDFYARCAVVYDQLHKDKRQQLVACLTELDVAIDEACAARDWSALVRAVKTCEHDVHAKRLS